MAKGLMGLILLLCVQDPNTPPAQKDVNAALDKAGAWLAMKANSGLPGDSPISSGKGNKFDALVLYAMHHAGVDKKKPAYKNLLDRISKMPIRTTYMAATIAMALAEIDRVKYKKQLWKCAQFLVDNMAKNGQWSYGKQYKMPEPPNFGGGSSTVSKTVIKQNNPVGGDNGDNSNSQYAALGLYACYRSGFEFEKRFLDKAIAWWETTQKGDGSWDYGEQGGKFKTAGFGSMAAGGASSIIMLRRMKGQKVKSSKARRTISWCGKFFQADGNPEAPDDRQRFRYYWLYAVERLGDLYPMEKFGRVKWYAQGANWLLENQFEDGSWREGSYPGMEIVDTCFAILFLQRVMAVKTTSAFDKKK